MFEMETNLINFNNSSYMSKKTPSQITLSKGRLKRKRPHSSITNASDYIDLDIKNDESRSSSPTLSTSSSTSSTSSLSSSLDNQLDSTTMRNPHKIFITEEKMANALRELQLQTNATNTKSSLEEDDLNENESDLNYVVSNSNTNLSIHNNSEFHVTNELKQILNNHNLTDLDLNKLIEQQNKMQLIPYIPIKIPSELTTSYQVEEPFDNKKNQLKRTYSQLNKITIEELNSMVTNNNKSQGENNTYLVDEGEDESSANTTSSTFMSYDKAKPHFNIIELDEIKNDEEMEI